jgi:hypothetical protein
MIKRPRRAPAPATALYTRVAISALGQVTSPLDFLLKMPG